MLYLLQKMMANMVGPGSGPHQQMMGNMNMPHMAGSMGPRAHLSQQQQQQQQQMMGGMNSCMLRMGPGGMMNQKQSSHMMGGGQTVQAQMEWNKLQHQFFEERKGDDHRMDGGRSGHMQSERDRIIHAERMFQMNMGGPPMGGMMPGNRQIPGSIKHPNQQQQQQQFQQHQQQFQQHHQQGSRLQGPLPPYHQTQRSASVPIATQSPNPSSPTNNPHA